MKRKHYLLACFWVLCTTATLAQIVNTGTLQIESSTTVFFGDEYTNKSEATHTNEGDLYLNHNFINNGTTSVTSSGTTFFVLDDISRDTQTISGTTGEATFYNIQLNVASGEKGVSVADEFGLVVTNSVTLLNGDLRLVGEAQLIQTHTGGSANSAISGKLLKDQQGTNSVYDYNFWSSPVNTGVSYALSNVLFDGTDSDSNLYSPTAVQYTTNFDGEDGTPITISSRWLYTYPPSSSGYDGWLKIDQNSSINPSRGFIMKGTGSSSEYQNYVFKGVPNDGTYYTSVTSGDIVLLGNPYPSALDASEFIDDNSSLIDAVYFWVEGGSTSHNLSNYYGGYAARNLVTGVTAATISGIAGLGSVNTSIPTQYIPVGQGFFIEATGSGSITFKNSQRAFQTETDDNSIFYKSANSKKNEDVNDNKSLIYFGFEDPVGFHRQIALGFVPNSNATLGVDRGYDAVLFGERDDDMFFVIDNDEKKYVIQGVGEFNDEYSFKLGIKITNEDKKVIVLDRVENFENDIFLVDHALQKTYNLRETPVKFTLPVGVYKDRFSIVFKQTQQEEVESSLTPSQLKVYYNGNNSIIVQNYSPETVNTIVIFNTLGQEILRRDDISLQNDQITLPFNVQQNMYFVNLTTSKGTQTFKIVN